MPKAKLGRPRLGKKPRRVLSASVASETYQYIMATVRNMPAPQRRPGMVLDYIVNSYRSNLCSLK